MVPPLPNTLVPPEPPDGEAPPPELPPGSWKYGLFGSTVPLVGSLPGMYAFSPPEPPYEELGGGEPNGVL